MALSPIGRIMAVTFTTPLVKLFGDDQAAWVKTMAIWAVLALLMLITCFKNCEEKVKIKVVKKEKDPCRKDIFSITEKPVFLGSTDLMDDAERHHIDHRNDPSILL